MVSRIAVDPGGLEMIQPTVLIVHRKKHPLHHRQDEIFERLASHNDVVAIKPKWNGKCAILSVWISLLKRAATRKPVDVCWTGDLTVAAFAKELKALGLSRKFVYDDPDFFPLDYSGRGILGVVVSILDQRIIKGADLIVSCTPQLTRLRSKQGARKVLTIPDGVDTALFKQCFEDRLKKCDKSEFRPEILLYSGQFGFDKGLDILPEALAIVLERHSRTDLLITGSGRPSFLRKFHDMGLTSHIKFLGRVPRTMLPEIFLRADIGLSLGTRPALRYGMPHKILEYMASGLPVVATATPPTVEMIARSNGAICVDATAESVANGIMRILEMPRDAYLDMCKAARSKWKMHEWRDLVLEYKRQILEVAHSS